MSNKVDIRFKFMPTPSCGLHAGHAWLLMLMKELAAKAREDGLKSDIILVVDDMTAISQNADVAKMKANAESIVEDSKWLGIEYSHVVWNSEYLYPSKLTKYPIRWQYVKNSTLANLTNGRFDGVFISHEYYQKNVMIDAALGVTHIIRGEDQIAKFAIYQAYYELFNILAPRLVYMPFVGDEKGGKITGHGTPHTIAALRDKISSDDLFIRIVDTCLKVPAEKCTSPQQARDKLLSYDWRWIISGGESQNFWNQFMARIEPQPKLLLPAEVAGAA